MVDSLRNETVVTTSAAREAFGIKPLRLDQAIERALAEGDRGSIRTRWSVSFPSRRKVAGSGRTGANRRMTGAAVTPTGGLQGRARSA